MAPRPRLILALPEVTVTYLKSGTVSLWHHEEIDVLVVSDTWIHILVRHGVGAIPELEDLSALFLTQRERFSSG
jgi:hypothetical protein